jgi:hypothetical protein
LLIVHKFTERIYKRWWRKQWVEEHPGQPAPGANVVPEEEVFEELRKHEGYFKKTKKEYETFIANDEESQCLGGPRGEFQMAVRLERALEAVERAQAVIMK